VDRIQHNSETAGYLSPNKHIASLIVLFIYRPTHLDIGIRLINHRLMQIRLILTGGTIDKAYNELTGELEFDKPHIDEMLTAGRLRVNVQVSEIMQMDSLIMVEANRHMIAEACKNSSEERIVVLHGTDTMPETARYIEDYALSNKVIILTGAMVPYSFGISSDAMFNLGTAIAYAQSLSPGVYIAMNGRYFAAAKVKKDRIIGRFTDS
jgi:L-asparaginase